jgi:hypothetical protein
MVPHVKARGIHQAVRAITTITLENLPSFGIFVRNSIERNSVLAYRFKRSPVHQPVAS